MTIKVKNIKIDIEVYKNENQITAQGQLKFIFDNIEVLLEYLSIYLMISQLEDGLMDLLKNTNSNRFNFYPDTGEYILFKFNRKKNNIVAEFSGNGIFEFDCISFIKELFLSLDRLIKEYPVLQESLDRYDKHDPLYDVGYTYNDLKEFLERYNYLYRN